MSHSATSERVTVRDDGTDRIDVTGPAVVRVPSGFEYEVVTDMTLAFPVDSDVWLKVWPREID